MRDIVDRAREGDRDAFAALAHAEADDLYAVAYRILRDADLAQDALQVTLIRAWRRVRSLPDSDRFSAWVLQILVDACVAEARRRWQTRAPVVPVEPEPPNGPLTTDDREALDAAFKRLPVEQRAAFVLHGYVGLGVDEIAETLAVPPGLAAARLHEATRALRASVDSVEPLLAMASGPA